MKATEIQIPEPCDEDWDAMTPAERGRKSPPKPAQSLYAL